MKAAIADLKAGNPEEMWLVEQIAQMAVKAAEQANFAGLIDDKKAYAFDVAEKWLLAKGIKLDLDVLDAAIEAAVKDVFNPKDGVSEVARAKKE